MSEKRSASVKETGEELPQEQWERFEAAVDAAIKSGPKRKRSNVSSNSKLPAAVRKSPEPDA